MDGSGEIGRRLIILLSIDCRRMSTEAEPFAQLRQMGFVDVDQWTWNLFGRADEQQQQLLAVLRNDPQATELK